MMEFQFNLIDIGYNCLTFTVCLSIFLQKACSVAIFIIMGKETRTEYSKITATFWFFLTKQDLYVISITGFNHFYVKVSFILNNLSI